MGVKIQYSAVADYDKDDMTVTNNGASDYSNPEQLKSDTYSDPQAGSFESNYLRAGDRYMFISTAGLKCAAWESAAIADNTGKFAVNPTVSLSLGQTLSTRGITLYFASYGWIYPKTVKITWQTPASGSVVSTEYNISSNIWYFSCPVSGYTAIQIEFVTCLPNQRARIERIDFGKQFDFSVENDNVVTASLRTVANMVADEIEVNTSSATVIIPNDNDDMGLLNKRQAYRIYHNGRYLSTHYAKTIKKSGNIALIDGQDIFGRLDDYMVMSAWVSTDSSNPTRITKSFLGWITDVFYDTTHRSDHPLDPDIFVFDIDTAISSLYLSTVISEQITLRTLLTKLCLAAGAYVDTVSDNKIHIRSLSALLSAGRVGSIPETSVFSGDTEEQKDIYKYLRLKYKDVNDVEHYAGYVNTSETDSTAAKEFELTAYPTDSGGNDANNTKLWALANLYTAYYFRSDFYNAKSVCSAGEKPGDKITINGRTGRIFSRNYTLDGNKLVAEGVYKIE